MSDRISANLCSEHFERLACGNVCPTCPSEIKNEEVVLAISKQLDQEPARMQASVFGELASLRQHQERQSSLLEKLVAAVHGNGKPGLTDRMTIIETKMESRKNASSYMLTVLGLVVSSIIGLIGLIAAFMAVQGD